MGENLSPLQKNSRDLEAELTWFSSVVDTRFRLYFQKESPVDSVFAHKPPPLHRSDSYYADFVRHYEPSFVERFTLILSLVPHLRPQLLDVFHTRNQAIDRPFTEFGGVSGESGAFLPTGETLAFLLAGTDLEARFALEFLFDRSHFFSAHAILQLRPEKGQSPFQTIIRPSDEFLGLFTIGRGRPPDFSAGFPAQRIETALTWDDLVLHPGTRRQIDEIASWIRHGQTLLHDWEMAPKLRPGYRSLFYGPPGTGKTMTACLLGQSTGRAVYKIDLALMVSKYIGETEKNLASVFDQAQNRGWILFFDEADALFGKRSETRSAHDRYANQEVSYLLQRIETFDGIAILASNQRENLDEAFTRRFESIIFFPMPRSEERLRLWQQGFSPHTSLSDQVDLAEISRRYQLSGGSIMNVIRFASLQSLENGNGCIDNAMLREGIQREFAKEGKTA